MSRTALILLAACVLLLSGAFADPPRPMPGGDGDHPYPGDGHYPGDGPYPGDGSYPGDGPYPDGGGGSVSEPHPGYPSGHSDDSDSADPDCHAHSGGDGGHMPPGGHGSEGSSSAGVLHPTHYGEHFDGQQQQGSSAQLSPAKLGAIIGCSAGAVVLTTLAVFLYVRSRTASGRGPTASASDSVLARRKPPTDGVGFSKENHLPERFDDAVKFDVEDSQQQRSASPHGSVVMGIMMASAGRTSSAVAAEGHVVVAVLPINHESATQSLGYLDLPGALTSPSSAAVFDSKKV